MPRTSEKKRRAKQWILINSKPYTHLKSDQDRTCCVCMDDIVDNDLSVEMRC